MQVTKITLKDMVNVVDMDLATTTSRKKRSLHRSLLYGAKMLDNKTSRPGQRFNHSGSAQILRPRKYSGRYDPDAKGTQVGDL